MLSSQILWQECVNSLIPIVGREGFETWLKPIRLKEVSNDLLTLEVPNAFFLEWLEEHYGNIIINAVKNKFSTNTTVQYVTYKENEIKKKDEEIKINSAIVKYAQFIKNNFPNQNNISGLNSKYSFDNFIVGSRCNSFTKNVAMSIAAKPFDSIYNPLLIHGSVGLGKTHLLNAIGNYIKINFPEKNVFYMQTTVFIDQFIKNIRNNTSQEFTNFYSSADVLLLDDIQFLNGKNKTQEILFYIFNQLHQLHKQIVITSDRSTKDLKKMGGMQERLLSRFVWGLTTELTPPDLETRMAILKYKTTENCEIDDSVIEYIAQRVDSNVRELEGVMITAMANMCLDNKMDIDTVKNIIDNIVTNNTEVDRISYAVAEYFNLTLEDMFSKSRQKDIALARQIAMYLAKTYTKCTLEKIGALMGGRDHSTVIHAVLNISKMIKENEKIKKIVKKLEKEFAKSK